MKLKITLLFVCMLYFFNWSFAQTDSYLIDHYKMYYAQMQKQGDVQGIINAMTHLLVLDLLLLVLGFIVMTMTSLV